jgi:predicted metal-dependent phosphoesterase TrpH
MEASTVRQKLHEFIDTIEDKKAEAIYTLFIDEIDIDTNRKNLVEMEREKYLQEQGKSYSWDEVKEMAMNKDKRHAI